MNRGEKMNGIKSIQNLDPNCVIKWRPTDLCNYNCTYCIRKPLVEEKEIDRVSVAKMIANLADRLSRRSGKMCKIDLIGGEVTILSDLAEIIEELGHSVSVEKINITTNFSKPTEYFEELYTHTAVPITMTVSYHPDYYEGSLEDFIKKASEVSQIVYYLKCETVKTKDSTHIDEFIRLCEEYGLDYMVEGDLMDADLKEDSCSSVKPDPRYLVTFDDGHTETFYTRNEFLKKYGNPDGSVDVKGYNCSRDYDYIYIDKDEIYSCTRKHNPATFSPLKKVHKCYRSNGLCTLCGNISVYKNEEENNEFE